MGRLSTLGAIWWGHSTVTVEVAGVRLVTDPLFSRRLLHLSRASAAPGPAAAVADLVLISHLHQDHLHLPSLQAFDPGVPIVVPRGAPHAVPGLSGLHLVEAAPGDVLEVSGVTVEVLAAHHDGRRHNLSRHRVRALGFRVTAGARSVWYAGDTGWHDAIADVAAVDLALVPIGGWGPTLGAGHLDPHQAARAVALVGATWSLPVHHGTFWPVGMRSINPGNHRRLFEGPAEMFVAALKECGSSSIPLTPRFGERVDLGAGTLGSS